MLLVAKFITECGSDNTTVIISGLDLWDMDFEIWETSTKH